MHEAAHVVAACYYKRRFKKVVIKNLSFHEHQKDPVKGYVTGINSSFALRKNYKERMERIRSDKGEEVLKDLALQNCVILASALLASKKFLKKGGDLRNFGYSDVDHIEKIILELHGDYEGQRLFFNEVMTISHKVISDYWKEIIDLGEVLYEEEVMTKQVVFERFPNLKSLRKS